MKKALPKEQELARIIFEYAKLTESLSGEGSAHKIYNALHYALDEMKVSRGVPRAKYLNAHKV